MEEVLKDDKKAKLEKEKSEAADLMAKFASKPGQQLKLSDCVKVSGLPYKKAHPIQKRFCLNMKNLKVNDALPFEIADSKWFWKLVNDLDLRITVNWRQTFSKLIKKEGDIIRRAALKHVSDSVCSGFASSDDIWTSKAQDDILQLMLNSLMQAGDGKRLCELANLFVLNTLGII